MVNFQSIDSTRFKSVACLLRFFFNLNDSETCHLDISDDLYDDIKDIFYSLYFHSSDLDFSNLTDKSGLLIRNDHIVLDGSLIDEETKIKILSGNLLQVDRLLVSQVISGQMISHFLNIFNNIN